MKLRADSLARLEVVPEPMIARRPLSAWLMSLFLHSALLITMAMTLRFAPRGVAIEPHRSAGIVLVHQQQGEREYFDGDLARAAEASVTASPLSDALPTQEDLPVDLAGALPQAQDLDSLGGSAGVVDAEDLTAGGRRQGAIDGSTSTQVFGITGHGSKFVYVFDRSGSMDGYGGRPLRAAKSELLRSLQDLDRIHQFQIIFYNEQPRIFTPSPGPPTLVWGDERGKKLATEFVGTITATGGTRHLDALKLALGMRPDVIFFLTDADEPQLTSSELAWVRRRNQNTMIHAIEFGFGPQHDSNNFLVRLAAQNGGQHAYLDISRIGPAR
jgi:hypothetical protein